MQLKNRKKKKRGRPGNEARLQVHVKQCEPSLVPRLSPRYVFILVRARGRAWERG